MGGIAVKVVLVLLLIAIFLIAGVFAQRAGAAARKRRDAK
jgi:outer membrane lipoprotein-sorting protein